MINNISAALEFIVDSLFGFYLMALIIRALLQMGRANPANSITRFIIMITKPPVALCQYFLPTIKQFDLAIVFIALVLVMLKLEILFFLQTHLWLPNFLGLVVWAFADLLQQVFNLFFFAILAQVIISWVAMGRYHPMMEVLFHITNPVLRPFQRLIPAIGGLDISPIFAIMLLKTLDILILFPLVKIGQQLMLP